MFFKQSYKRINKIFKLNINKVDMCRNARRNSRKVPVIFVWLQPKLERIDRFQQTPSNISSGVLDFFLQRDMAKPIRAFLQLCCEQPYKHENCCLLGCCVVHSGRFWPKFPSNLTNNSPVLRWRSVSPKSLTKRRKIFRKFSQITFAHGDNSVSTRLYDAI
jgi:hypothetical protein